jgi:hypothetical protein
MNEVLAASLAFPGVIFAGVIALALIYWVFVILGALDLDLLGGAEDAAMPDLGMDGAVKGALEGAKGALEGAKGATEGLGGDGAGEDGGGLAALFASLDLGRAPATVVLTILATFSWAGSVLGTMTLDPMWAAWGLPHWLLGLLLLITSVAVALPLTAIVVRPLGPLFATRAAASRNDVIGKVCVISTGRVNERFGQATLADGGAGLILDVRCDTPGALRQGDKALLVSWDQEREAFEVEPLDGMLDEPAKKPKAARVEAAPAKGGPAVAEAPTEEDAPAGRSQGRAG